MNQNFPLSWKSEARDNIVKSLREVFEDWNHCTNFRTAIGELQAYYEDPSVRQVRMTYIFICYFLGCLLFFIVRRVVAHPLFASDFNERLSALEY